ncbi:MAG: guanylate kinase [Schleiferiaceae bacterium]|nr:guanylate kinase [Schleiferiaceae bacterium]
MPGSKLIIFSAPSGSGKTTIVHHLLNTIDSLSFSISATSRPPRGAEEDGKDYYFLSTAAFQEKIANNEFLEYEEVYKGAFYGTLRTEVERIWSLGKHVIFDIDVEGGINLKKQFPQQALSVFVKIPNLDILEHRLRNRGTDTEEKIAERLAKADKEMQRAHAFDVQLVNEDLQVACKEAYDLVTQFLEK